MRIAAVLVGLLLAMAAVVAARFVRWPTAGPPAPPPLVGRPVGGAAPSTPPPPPAASPVPASPAPAPAASPALRRGRVRVPPSLRGLVVELCFLPDPGPSFTVPVTRIRHKGQVRDVRLGSDGEGGFSLDGLAPGRYRCAVAIGRHGNPRELPAVEVPAAGGELVIDVPEYERSEFLVVRAHGPDGSPVRHADVLARYREGTTTRAVSLHEYRRPDGSFEVFFVWHGDGDAARGSFDPERGEFLVRVRSAEFGVRSTVVKASKAPEATIDFESPGSLVVRVDGLAAIEPRDRFQASLWSGAHAGGCSQGADRDPLRDEGVARFRAVQPGAWTFELRIKDGDSNWPVLRVPVTVGRGEQSVSATLPALGTVTLRGARGQVELVKSDEEDWTLRFMLSPDEPRTLSGLPPGRYRAMHRGMNTVFDVPGAETVDLPGR